MSLTALVALAIGLQSPVEVPFRIGDHAIIVDAMVNGKKVSCMFDTGFTGAFVVNDEISLGPPSGTMNLQDFVGRFTRKTVKVNSLKLGSLTIDPTGMEIVQQPLSHMSASYNTHTDGIMGLEVVAGYVTEINFEKQKFVFHPKSVDVSARTPDNKKTWLVKMLPIGRKSIELTVKTAQGGRMHLALDTGNAFFATTHKEVLEREKIWDPRKDVNFMRTAWVASGPVDSWYKMFKDLDIFGVPVPSSVWSIIDLPASSVEHDGTVGFGFLKNFNIVIDMERRRVWLENWTGKTGNEPTADVGISAAQHPSGKIVIYRVTPGSPAEKAGIKAGDALLDIDGVSTNDLTPRQLEAALEGALDSAVKLAVSRSGNLVRHELKRAYLVNGISN
ncbi:MAG TPA: PDZ domain-containing protein [Fimbriimonadaceae bacterium]|nr:PDZ domain-containing protein [Fimbriimonadaceae bacterium]HRJ97361.1 PDZ domain-containing protein [Fimbriimonadaceae bacterium]